MFYILEVSVITHDPMETKMHGPYKTERARDKIAKQMRGHIPERDMTKPRFYRVNIDNSEAAEEKKAA